MDKGHGLRTRAIDGRIGEHRGIVLNVYGLCVFVWTRRGSVLNSGITCQNGYYHHHHYPIGGTPAIDTGNAWVFTRVYRRNDTYAVVFLRVVIAVNNRAIIRTAAVKRI